MAMSSVAHADGVERHHVTGSHAFSIAVCEHLGINPGKVFRFALNDGPNEVFGVTVSVSLNADDIAAIARRMGAVEQRPQAH